MRPNWNRNAVTDTTYCKPARCRTSNCPSNQGQWMTSARERYRQTLFTHIYACCFCKHRHTHGYVYIGKLASWGFHQQPEGIKFCACQRGPHRDWLQQLKWGSQGNLNCWNILNLLFGRIKSFVKPFNRMLCQKKRSRQRWTPYSRGWTSSKASCRESALPTWRPWRNLRALETSSRRPVMVSPKVQAHLSVANLDSEKYNLNLFDSKNPTGQDNIQRPPMFKCSPRYFWYFFCNDKGAFNLFYLQKLGVAIYWNKIKKIIL